MCISKTSPLLTFARKCPATSKENEWMAGSVEEAAVSTDQKRVLSKIKQTQKQYGQWELFEQDIYATSY